MRPPVIVTVLETNERGVVARGQPRRTMTGDVIEGGTWRIPWSVVPPEERAGIVPGAVCELARQKPKTLRVRRGGT